MTYVITPVQRGQFTRYQLRKGTDFIGEFPTLQQCEAMRDASESAGNDDFLRGYIEAIYFTDIGDLGQPECDAELSDDARALCIADCVKFQADNDVILAQAYATGYEPVQAGRDFWFTRNGHGAGYWDRDELQPDAMDGSPDLSEFLSDAAREWGALSAYAADNGSIGLEG